MLVKRPVLCNEGRLPSCRTGAGQKVKRFGSRFELLNHETHDPADVSKQELSGQPKFGHAHHFVFGLLLEHPSLFFPVLRITRAIHSCHKKHHPANGDN